MQPSPAPTTPVTLTEWLEPLSPLLEKRYGAAAARDLILATGRNDEGAARRLFAAVCPHFELTTGVKGDAIIVAGTHRESVGLPKTLTLPRQSTTIARAIIRLAAVLHPGFANMDPPGPTEEVLFLSEPATEGGEAVYHLVEAATGTIVATHKRSE